MKGIKLPQNLPVFIIWMVASLLFARSSFAQSRNTQKSAQPNIVLIISDDQAWADYGFMGHAVVETPHLDRLAARSIRFDRGYVAASLCRSSLATMVTGLFPAQHGITANDVTGGMFVIDEQGDTVLLQSKRKPLEKPVQQHFHELPSFIRSLSESGYLTHQSGKWWEGSYQDGGFTHGMTEGERHGDKGLTIGRDGMQPVEGFIDYAVAQDQPFFLWYAPFLPHTPHNPPDRLLNKYLQEGRALDVANYYAMIEWFDETCGQLLKGIESRGLSENTVIIYICDNGWAPASTTGDWPRDQAWKGFAMRSKASPYENGIRTPVLISWPGKLAPKRETGFAHSIDLYPTIGELAGIEVPEDLSGINLLDSEAVRERDTVYGSLHSTHNMTVGDPDDTLQYLWCIENNWKLIMRFDGEDSTEYRALHTWDTAPFRLFNLEQDPGEKNDLAAARPELVDRLRQKIEAWRRM